MFPFPTFFSAKFVSQSQVNPDPKYLPPNMAAKHTARAALVERITKETSVQVALSLDGGPVDLLPTNEKFDSLPDQTITHHATQDSTSQQIWVWTGIGFLDHMIHALAKHSGWSLRVRTLGDLASQ